MLPQLTRLTTGGPRVPAWFSGEGAGCQALACRGFQASELRKMLEWEGHGLAPDYPRGWGLICRILRFPVLDFRIPFQTTDCTIDGSTCPVARNNELRARGPSVVRSFRNRKESVKPRCGPPALTSMTDPYPSRSRRPARPACPRLRITSIREPCGGYGTRSGWTTSRQYRSVT